MNEGDAGVDRLRAREPCPTVHVAGLEFLPKRRCGAKIAELRLFARHAAQQRIPHMPVRLDQSGHQDHALALDRRRARRLDELADLDDDAVTHVHIAAREIRHAGLHGHHVGVADDDVVTRRQPSRRRWRRECRCPREAPHRHRRSRAASQQATPAEVCVDDHVPVLIRWRTKRHALRPLLCRQQGVSSHNYYRARARFAASYIRDQADLCRSRLR